MGEWDYLFVRGPKLDLRQPNSWLKIIEKTKEKSNNEHEMIFRSWICCIKINLSSLKAPLSSNCDFIYQWQVSIQKNYSDSNIFLPSFTLYQLAKNLSDQLLLTFSWFKKFKNWLVESCLDHIQLKTYKPTFTFLQPISACQKSSWFISSHLRHDWFCSSAIWAKSFLQHLFKSCNHADWSYCF